MAASAIRTFEWPAVRSERRASAVDERNPKSDNENGENHGGVTHVLFYFSPHPNLRMVLCGICMAEILTDDH